MKNKTLKPKILSQYRELCEEKILPTIDLVDFFVGPVYTTILTRYDLSNPFSHFCPERTRSSYTVYNLPNQSLKLFTSSTLEENKKIIEKFIQNPDIVLPDIDNGYRATSLLSHLTHHIEVAQPNVIIENLVAMSSKEKLVEDALLAQLKLILPALNSKKFVELSFNSHTFPGEKIEQEGALHASGNQKIFAPYTLLTFSATLDRNEGYFGYSMKEFAKEVFLNLFSKPFGKKVKIKYSMEIYRSFYFAQKQMWNLPLNIGANPLDRQQEIGQIILLQKNPKNSTIDSMYALLSQWYTEIQTTNYYKRFEKMQLEKILSAQEYVLVEGEAKIKATRKSPHKI